MQFITSLLYFSVRLLRVFMPKEQIPASPHPHIPALRPNKRDSSPQNLGDWATGILSSHHSPKAVAQWRISTIYWFKTRSGFEHEYPVMVAERDLGEEEKIFLRMDRRSSPEILDARKEEVLVNPETYAMLTNQQRKDIIKTVNQERQALAHKRLKGIIISSKTSSGKDGGFQPEDTIVRSRHFQGVDFRDHDKVELMATYTNFLHPFPLRDLSIISQAVIDSADSYLLLVQQCYWFARTLVGICVAKYQPQPEGGIREQAFSHAGRLTLLPFIPPINVDNNTEISALLEHVNREIEIDDARVQLEYMNGEGGRIAAEEAHVAAEQARVAAEQARVAAEQALSKEQQERAQEQQERAREQQERARERAEAERLRMALESRTRELEDQLAAHGLVR